MLARCFCCSTLALCLTTTAVAAEPPEAALERTTVMVAMRDGALLATDAFHTKSKTPRPVIFVRGPYGKNGVGKGMAERVGRRGYNLVVQDMRGRFDSKGSDAVVFHNDGWSKNRDGHDSLEWIAKQTWCDGNVATWGGSALGITQTMMAPGAPDVLKAQYVQVAFSDMYSQCAYQGGVWRKSLIEFWLTANKFHPDNLKITLAHPRYDDFWAETNADAQAERVNCPGIFWGGWYDIFLQGTIQSFTTIHHQGGPRARGKCRLILGPIAHGPFTELKYPDNSRRDPDAADSFRFFDHHLRGKANGVEHDKPVHYYVMGDPLDATAPGNVWRAADDWPPESKPTKFFLHRDRTISNEPPQSSEGRLEYRYDPAEPAPTLGGQNLIPPKGPTDHRSIESRPDVLVFSTPVLEKPLEITGAISANLHVESDCPDTDFAVYLADVYPDGRSMLVTDGILRARYRNGFDREALLEPRRVYELNVDLWSTSLIVNRGHRLRVIVTSSNAPRFEPNPNTGRPFRSDLDLRVATNTLHASKDHPSSIVLPVRNEP